MAAREVITFESDSDEECVMLGDDEVAAASAAAAAAATAEDAEFARRLQEEAWNEPSESPQAPRRQYGAQSRHPVPSRAPTLRDEIDSAFEESLRQDQEKERAAKAREASEREAARASQAAAAAALLSQQQADRAAAAEAADAAARRLRWQAAPEPAPDAAGALSLQVRYPDGSRLSRRFPSSETVAGLFDAIMSLGPAPPGFCVATGFPRRVLSAAELGGEATLAAAGVGDRDILLVTTNIS